GSVRPVSPPRRFVNRGPSLSDVRAVLTTASALTSDQVEESDFVGDTYKGFPIIPRSQIPKSLPQAHAALELRFYVLSPLGAVGLVPWPGSKIVLPWA